MKYFLEGFWRRASNIESKICLEFLWFIAKRNPSGRKVGLFNSESVFNQNASRWGWKVTKNSSSFASHSSVLTRLTSTKRSIRMTHLESGYLNIIYESHMRIKISILRVEGRLIILIGWKSQNYFNPPLCEK